MTPRPPLELFRKFIWFGSATLPLDIRTRIVIESITAKQTENSSLILGTGVQPNFDTLWFCMPKSLQNALKLSLEGPQIVHLEGFCNCSVFWPHLAIPLHCPLPKFESISALWFWHSYSLNSSPILGTLVTTQEAKTIQMHITNSIMACTDQERICKIFNSLHKTTMWKGPNHSPGEKKTITCCLQCLQHILMESQFVTASNEPRLQVTVSTPTPHAFQCLGV